MILPMDSPPSPREVFAVVDMQDKFAAALDEALIRRIEAEAEEVLGRGGKVVAVCYEDSGEMTVRLPEGTPVVWKDRREGGDELFAYLTGADLIADELLVRLGGVNLSACVWYSAVTLSNRLSSARGLIGRVEIVLSLCGDTCNGRVRIVP